MNQITNATLHQVALSDQEGEIDFFLSSDMNTGSSGLFVQPKYRQGSQRTKTVTLDSFLEGAGVGAVRLIKLDCEGGEVKVVPGMVKSLRARCFDFIILEYHPAVIGPEGCTRIGNILADSGYLLSQVGSGLWIYHRKEVQSELTPLGPVTLLSVDSAALP